MNQEALRIADNLFSAIEAGDVNRIREIYSPNARIWHNTDNITQTVDENLAILKWVTTHIEGLKYTDVRRHATEDGFVQQHVLRGSFKGKELALPACIVVTIEGGRISQLDEYLDSAQTAIFRS